MTTAERLVEFARLMNLYGADSLAASDFLLANSIDDAEFASLAETARDLKRAFEDQS